MKKHQKLAIILSLGLSLMGCGGVGTEENPDSLPVASNDMLTLVNGVLYTKPHRIPVLDNDKPDGELDVSSVEIITPPQHGIATPQSNGEVQYDPTSSLLKADSFEYTVKDKNGNYSNPATVTITILDNTLAFIIKVDTRNTITYASNGTGNTTFQIPTKGADYDYNVDCGDGSPLVTGITGDYKCEYATPNEYTISITGKFPQIYFTNPPLDNEKLNSIEQWGGQKWRSMSHAFQYCKNMTSNAIDTPDLRLVKNMDRMFLSAESFEQENIHQWDVSKVEDMQYMFYLAKTFNNDISNWTVSSVTNMNHMFWNAEAFNQNIGGWNVSSVENMNSMFEYADSFDQNIGNWNVGSTTVMNDMLKFANSFTTANYDRLINGWFSLPSLQTNVVFSAGTTQYSDLSGESRGLIISTYNWDITDGGLKP